MEAPNMSGLPWVLLILCVVSGGIGWAVVEFCRWFFSHIQWMAT